MEQFLRGIYRLAGEVDAKLTVDVVVYLGKDHGGMSLASAQTAEICVRNLSGAVGVGRNRKRDERFVRMESGVVITQSLYLQLLNGLNDLGVDELYGLFDIAVYLDGVQESRRSRTEQGSGLAGNDASVGQLDSNRGLTFGILRTRKCLAHDRSVLDVYSRLAHKHLDLLNRGFGSGALFTLTERLEVAADYFVLRCVAAGVVINNAVARHIDTHIGGRLIGALARYLLKDGVQNGEHLNVAVVVDGGYSVCLKVIGVDHIHIVKIGGSRLVREVDGMAQGKIPDGEGLEFSVAGLYAALVFVIKLRKAGSHLAASGTGSGHNDQRTLGLDVLVLSEALVADDVLNVVGIALDRIVQEYLDTKALKLFLERLNAGLAAVLSDAYAADVKSDAAEGVDETEHVGVVGDADIAADLIVLDMLGIDNDNNLGHFLELKEHLQLAVRLESGKNAGSVEIVKKLAAEFKIKLTAEVGNTLTYLRRLLFDISRVVKT